MNNLSQGFICYFLYQEEIKVQGHVSGGSALMAAVLWLKTWQQLKKVIAVVKHHYMLETPLMNLEDDQQETRKWDPQRLHVMHPYFS